MNFNWKGFVLFGVLLADVVSFAKGQCFDKSQNPDVMYCKAVQLQCPEDFVIYKPNVKASSRSCGSKMTAIQGVPVDLMAEISECYWKQSCLINFPKTPIFSDLGIEDTQSLEVLGWNCIRSKEINHDKYFTETICDGQKDIGTAHVDSGLFLSHDDIPWNYNRHSFPKRVQRKPTLECRKTLHMRQDQCLLLTMNMLNIDYEKDKLIIDNETITGVDLTKTFKFWTRHHAKNVPIVFTSETSQSKSGSGFVICYKKCDAEKGKESACESLIKPNQHMAKWTTSSDDDCENGVYLPLAESKPCTTTTTKPDIINGKCTLNDKLIKRRCKNCKQGITKCRKKYRNTCPDCCPGVNILEKCKPMKPRKKKPRKPKSRDKSKFAAKKKKKTKGNTKERTKP